MLDYGARMMDPILGRFINVDPLAEKYPEMSPFVYTANNPIRYIDPDGMDWYEFEGNVIWQKGNAKNYTSANGDVYNNIGTSYIETLLDGTAVIYNQNEIAGIYTLDEQNEALGNFETVQKLFGEDVVIKFEAWDSDQQAAMYEIYKVANWFGVSPGEHLQREEDKDSQIFGPKGPLVSPSYDKDGNLGAHEKKRGGGKAGKNDHQNQRGYKKPPKGMKKENKNKRKGADERRTKGKTTD